MNSSTKKILIGLSLTLLILASAFALAFSNLLDKGEDLTEQIDSLKERASKEASFNRINSLVQDTVEERSEIDKLFFADESDSISFLSNMESLARDNNLTLETKSLDLITADDKKTELIKVIFGYRGTRMQVDTFTKLLENLPYHSKLESLSLRNNQGENWTGDVTILITIQPRL